MNKIKSTLIVWIAGSSLALASGEDLFPKSMFDEPQTSNQVASNQEVKKTASVNSEQVIQKENNSKKNTLSYREGVLKKRKALLFKGNQECKYSLVDKEGNEIAIVDLSSNPLFSQDVQEINIAPYLNQQVTIQGEEHAISSSPYLVIQANIINKKQ